MRKFLYIGLIGACLANVQGMTLSDEEFRYRKERAKRAESKKRPLTPKQQKARNKSKRASKSRNKLRKHSNYKIQLKNERKSRSIK